MKYFNEEQITTLSQWDYNFNTAVNARYVSTPGRYALQTIYDLFTSVTGDTRRFSDNCNTCIFNLMHDCGVLYFKSKEAIIEEKNRKAFVELTQKEAKKTRKKVNAVK